MGVGYEVSFPEEGECLHKLFGMLYKRDLYLLPKYLFIWPLIYLYMNPWLFFLFYTFSVLWHYVIYFVAQSVLSLAIENSFKLAPLSLWHVLSFCLLSTSSLCCTAKCFRIGWISKSFFWVKEAGPKITCTFLFVWNKWKAKLT